MNGSTTVPSRLTSVPENSTQKARGRPPILVRRNPARLTVALVTSQGLDMPVRWANHLALAKISGVAVEWRFAPDDVARLRFAFSPMWEVVSSLRVLRHPGRHPLHLPWVRAVRPRVRALDLGELFALVPMTGYFPDFLTPPPDTTLPGFHAELDRVRETSPETALAELDELVSPDPARLAAFAADPAAGVQRVAVALEGYWELALAEFWPRVHALLEADVMWRSRRLASGGVRELFADLHDSVTWHGDRLLIVHDYAYDGPITGDGLLLVPSAFRGPRVGLMWEPYQPTMWYPARGIGNLWSA